MIGRELLNLVGCNINWVIEPAANCFRTGNHLGIQPGGIKDMLEFLADDIEDRTGVRVDVPLNRKGADILFVTPSGDFFADPGTYTCMGYMMLFHEIGLNYTFSTYASDSLPHLDTPRATLRVLCKPKPDDEGTVAISPSPVQFQSFPSGANRGKRRGRCGN